MAKDEVVSGLLRSETTLPAGSVDLRRVKTVVRISKIMRSSYC